MNFHDWILVTVPIVAVVITAINAWALKVYEIKKAKGESKSPQTAAVRKSEKNSVLWKRIMWISWFLTITFGLYGIIERIQHPQKNSNLDALAIALHVSEIFLVVILMVVTRVIGGVFAALDAHSAVSQEHATITAQLAILMSQSEGAREEHAKRLEALEGRTKRK